MKALVLGAGGFIGAHLVARLKDEGYYVVGADLKHPEFSKTMADKFYQIDLKDLADYSSLFHLEHWDEVYQLAADMGGAGYIFTGKNDHKIITNSSLININTGLLSEYYKPGKVFFSSSACVYPQELQLSGDVLLKESDAYPANPDSVYGWEKLMAEQMYSAYARNKIFDVRIARFHNIFGPLGTFRGGREKAPAAICRKIAEAVEGGEIEIWGDGKQRRSFLYIDDCIEGVRRLMASDYNQPVNIGSNQAVTINQLVTMVSHISEKQVKRKYVEGPVGVGSRNSDNTLIHDVLNWWPQGELYDGLVKTYLWIFSKL